MTEYHDITDEENRLLAKMKIVSFPLASFDKRFYRSIQNAKQLTDKQSKHLKLMVYRYRKQIKEKGDLK